MASFTDKVKAQVDKVLHKDSTSSSSNTGAGSTNAGPHNSNLANKADPRVDSDLDGSRNSGLATGNNAGSTGFSGASNTAGPHSSDLANKADPRVDSDLDGSNNYGAAGTGGYSSTAGTDYNNPQSGNLGPHSTNIANKLDPRVDSDGDRGYGSSGGVGSTGSGYGSSGGVGSTGSGYGASGGVGSTDSSYGATGGAGSTDSSYGATGGIGSTGSSGYGASGGLGASGGPGPAANTAGPHSSDLLNKADPRVDSDLDGSKTVSSVDGSFEENVAPKENVAAVPRASTPIAGHSRIDSKETNQSEVVSPKGAKREESPPDAAKHSPSKFLDKQLKEGVLDHDDVNTDHHRRHSLKSSTGTKATLEKYGSGE